MPNDTTPLLGSSSKAPAVRDDDNLTKFRRAIGINSGAIATGDLKAARKGARGLYKEIIGIQRSRSRQYRVVDALYYLAIGAQILIGATLAALGPLSKLHPIAITILGIVNTSTAGVQALLKGQGLPDRLRKDEYQMRKVQDFIEETEIRLAIGGEPQMTPDELDQLVQQIFDKYHTARDTAEMNRPNSYAHQPDDPVEGTDPESSDSPIVRNRATSNGNDMAKGKFVID